MRIVSVSVAQAREVDFGSKRVRTSIVKEPVDGPVHLSAEGLEGDGMATPVYGGHRRPALYAYPLEHYEYWQEQLGAEGLSPGRFGENITTEGLLEPDVRAGDVYAIGDAVVRAIGFRIPCRNLGLTLDNSKAVGMFRSAGRPGIFFSVVEEGAIAAGDSISLVERHPQPMTIADMDALLYSGDPDIDVLKSLLNRDDLPGTILKDFRKKLDQLEQTS